MKKIFSLFLSLLFPLTAQPCSTIAVKPQNQIIVGKNYDWHYGYGIVYVNKRNVQKVALNFDPSSVPAKWISQHGSVTFNQFGRELPNGGINEAGLMIDIMWLTSSKYPTADQRQTVNELQWIQYMLDNYSSIDEMVKKADEIRVSMVAAPVHYLACDKLGACATFEYIDNKLKIHHGSELPYSSLTNDTYSDSVDHLKSFLGFGGTKPIPTNSSSLARFTRGTSMAVQLANRSHVEYDLETYKILDSISQDTTVWQLVYDLKTSVVNFRTTVNANIKIIDLNTLDFSCLKPVQMLNIDFNGLGFVNENLTTYSEIENSNLIKQSITDLPTPIPPQKKQIMIEMASQYPNTTVCLE